MNLPLMVMLVAGTFTLYPNETASLPRVEAITDRGPILEMIIHCRSGTGIMTYSKMEKLYCGPRNRCNRDPDIVIARICN